MNDAQPVQPPSIAAFCYLPHIGRVSSTINAIRKVGGSLSTIQLTSTLKILLFTYKPTKQ